jgi:undecaprenyl-diphosphatase
MGVWLNALDQKLSIGINHFGAPYLDSLMIVWSSKWVWLPLYALLLLWLFRRYPKKTFLLLVAGMAVTVTLADQTASALFKPLFERLRPCHDPAISKLIRLPDGCGGFYGFASSHAANTMALAIFFTLLPLETRSKGIWICLLIWAVVSGWSRIYLGYHYVGDIVCGYAIGALWASITQYSCRKMGVFRENPVNPA